MDGLIKNIEELPENLQDAIRRGIRTQIIGEADFYKEERETELLAYLDAEIKQADNSMLKMQQESTKVGAELFGISKTYVWNKERKKALINYKNDYKMQKQIEAKEPQQKDLCYYCQKGIDLGYWIKNENGYNRTEKITKAQLAYFLSHFKNEDGTFPDKKYSLMFNETRLGKSLSQLMDNKTGNGKPRGYSVIDNLLEM